MSSFTTPLLVEPLGGRRWCLAFAFTFHIGGKYAKKAISVPAGFITDFASIEAVGTVSLLLLLLYLSLSSILPWWTSFLFLWPAVAYLLLPKWAKYNKAPVLHDWLYQEHILTRAEADLAFYEAMLVAFRHHKTGRLVAWIEYISVRLFGWIAW